MYPKSLSYSIQTLTGMVEFKNEFTFIEGRLTKIKFFPNADTLSNEYNFEYYNDGNIKKAYSFVSKSRRILQTNSFFYRNGKIYQYIKLNNDKSIYGDSVTYFYDDKNKIKYYISKSYGQIAQYDKYLDSVLVNETQTSTGYSFDLRPISFDFDINSFSDTSRDDRIVFNNIDNTCALSIRNKNNFIKTTNIKWVLAPMRYLNYFRNSTNDTNADWGGYFHVLANMRPEMGLFGNLILSNVGETSSSDYEIATDLYGRVTQIKYFHTIDGTRRETFSSMTYSY